MLPIENIGAGSVKQKSKYQKIKEMVGFSSVKPKYGKLLFRIARYYKPSTIIELGTSVGVSTLYLAKGAPQSKIVTLEGNASVCDYARTVFKKYQLSNIKAMNGLFG